MTEFEIWCKGMAMGVVAAMVAGTVEYVLLFHVFG